MKIEEAIEILEIETSSRHEPLDLELFQAQCLGIEALKRVLLYRKGMYIGLGNKMPGETKE